MQDNSDLIGRRYRNGEDGVIIYEVTAIDSEFPEIIHWRNTVTEKEGCALADFVRPYLVNYIEPLPR